MGIPTGLANRAKGQLLINTIDPKGVGDWLGLLRSARQLYQHVIQEIGEVDCALREPERDARRPTPILVGDRTYGLLIPCTGGNSVQCRSHLTAGRGSRAQLQCVPAR